MFDKTNDSSIIAIDEYLLEQALAFGQRPLSQVLVTIEQQIKRKED